MKEKDFKNSYYEGLVHNLYAGSQGCFLAFMQFFYQYNQSVVFAKEYAACFERLYESELENCKILSALLLKMGGDNKYFSSSRKYVSGVCVDYIKDLGGIFSADLELLEINVIEVKNIIDKIEDKQIKFELKKILENKKKSLKKLKEIFFKNNLINRS